MDAQLLKSYFIDILKRFKETRNKGMVPLLLSESLIEVFGVTEAQSLADWAKYHTDMRDEDGSYALPF